MNRWGVSLFTLIILFTNGTALANFQTIPLPATLNQQNLGDVNTRLSNNDVVALDIRPIRARLERILPPDQIAKLPDAELPWVSPGQLELAGIRTQFDFQSLTLRLTVPPEQRREETLSLIGTPSVQANCIVLPNDFSAYLNVRGGVDYREGRRGGDEGFNDPQIAFENVFNLHGWVLENETVINPTSDKSWEKRDTRLVWDVPERRWRWTFGDLNYLVTSFQGFRPMAGFSFHRENTLQPYRVTSPLGQSSFYLKEDSMVEILVNGQTVRSLRLQAGPHQISNFPLTGGANNVILRITDPVGRVEYINATFLYDSGLLKGGDSEFNYAAGLPSRSQSDHPLYEYNAEPIASAYHRWGLTDTLTVGLNSQVAEVGQQGGGEMVLNTPVGVISLDAASTHNRGVGSGHVERLQYRFYAPKESLFTDGVFSFAVRYSDNFFLSDPFSDPISTGDSWDYQARYSQRFGEQFSAGLAYAEQRQFVEGSLRTYSLTVSHRRQRVSTDFTIQHREGSACREEVSCFVSVIINSGRGTTAYASYDGVMDSTRAEVQYTPPSTVESFSGAIGVQNRRGDQDVYSNVRYFGRRAEATLNHDIQTAGDTRTSLRWGSALTYAGGQFGLSRPINDSFAIFKSTGGLSEEGGLGVQPQSGRYAGREDWFGPAVLPELTAHYNTRVMAEPLQVDADMDPQEGDVMLQPTCRSGTLVRIGQPTSAYVTATLVWEDGRPAALQSGTVTVADGTEFEFITNREGVTYLHGLPLGDCRGVLNGHPDAPFTLDIFSDKNISIDLGTIKVPTKE